AGLRPEFIPHLFERFRQADTSTARRYGGLGIGLALVKQLTELHGGRVHAWSDGEGQGSTFVVELPLAISNSPSDEQREHPRAPAFGYRGTETCDLKGLRVLLVDDQPDALEMVQR